MREDKAVVAAAHAIHAEANDHSEGGPMEWSEAMQLAAPAVAAARAAPGAHVSPATVAEAVVEHVRGLLPPLADLAVIADPADMGPNVTLPAVYAHIVLTHLSLARADADHAKLMPTAVAKLVDRFRQISPGAKLTEDETGDFAGELATIAIMGTGGEAFDAILVLMRAAGAVALSRLSPAAFAVAAMRGAADLSITTLQDALGDGQARQ